jgi:2-polyprenyl-6-methoxyphenol hydroxylase-like FAD-dependent oxidoreductase
MLRDGDQGNAKINQTMNNLHNKQIAIVGGGPGGLTLARLLQLRGARVTVYERDVNKDARVQGATLDLHDESGLKALRQAGLMDAFTANYRPGADLVRIMDKHATIVMDEHERPKGEASRPEIDRGPLRKIMLDSLQPNTVVWDSYMLTLAKTDGRWKLTFQNGMSAFADIVIAADGANSKIRPLITPIKPFYAGITAVEGAIHHSETAAPTMHSLLKGGKIFAMSDEKTLIVSAKGDGSVAFYAGWKTEEDWARNNGIDFADKVQVVRWFKQEFKGWHSVWLELFERLDGPLLPRPQYCIPPDQWWEALPDLTMLGDAAHLMPPYAGEGVNMAMLDALELSDCLTDDGFADTRTAIAHYEKEMRRRSGETATMTLEQTAWLHSPEAITQMLELFG